MGNQIEELKQRREICNLANSIISSIQTALDKFANGSEVEYGYLREKLNKLNTLVENEVKNG